MNDIAPSQAPASTDMWQVTRRANDIRLKLLDGIEHDIANRVLPSPHMEAYEALCRAEATRRG